MDDGRSVLLSMQYTATNVLSFPVKAEGSKKGNPSVLLGESEEAEWLNALANGEIHTMDFLVEKWQDSLYRFFYRSLGNYADAQDLTQKTFIRTFKAASRYRPTAKFSSWLFTIARNLLIDEIKRKQKSQTLEFQEEINCMNLESSVEQSSIDEWKEILQLVLSEMPENQRSALLLRVQKEWSYLEIANLMGVNESVIKTWIHRARQRLKTKLEVLKKKGEI